MLPNELGGWSARDLDEWTIQTLATIKPLRHIWDIGPGRGVRGRLIHEAYPNVKLVGSEIHNEFEKPPWYYSYRTEDILEVMKSRKVVNPPYDLMLWGDILEHFPRGDMLSLLDWSLYQARWVMAIWPLNFIKVDHTYDEMHISQPRLEDFACMDLRAYTKVDAADGAFQFCGALVKGIRV